MNFSRVILATVIGAASLGVYAQAPDARDPKADNTRVNKRDRATGEPTADQQKNNHTDLDLTKDLRRSIVSDKTLSTYAHNVKIISQNGTITLKGPVKSDEEKKAIMSKAVSIAGGADKINDQMSVKQ